MKMLKEVIFKCEFEDKETGEIVEETYTLQANEFNYILKSDRMSYGQLFTYLNAIAKPEKKVKKK